MVNGRWCRALLMGGFYEILKVVICISSICLGLVSLDWIIGV